MMMMASQPHRSDGGLDGLQAVSETPATLSKDTNLALAVPSSFCSTIVKMLHVLPVTCIGQRCFAVTHGQEAARADTGWAMGVKRAGRGETTGLRRRTLLQLANGRTAETAAMPFVVPHDCILCLSFAFAHCLWVCTRVYSPELGCRKST